MSFSQFEMVWRDTKIAFETSSWESPRSSRLAFSCRASSIDPFLSIARWRATPLVRTEMIPHKPCKMMQTHLSKVFYRVFEQVFCQSDPFADTGTNRQNNARQRKPE